MSFPAIDISPKLVLEIASGVEDPKDIAARYGLSDAEWETLKVYDPFVKQVEAKKAELKSSGWTFRMKSAFCAEDLLEDVYMKAKQEDASFHTQLESLKFFARAAGLEAPAEKQQATGNKFSININLGGGQTIQVNVDENAARATQDNVVDAEVVGLPAEDGFDLGALPHFLPHTLPEFQIQLSDSPPL